MTSNGRKTKWDQPKGTVVKFPFEMPENWLGELNQLVDGMPRMMVCLDGKGGYRILFWGIDDPRDSLDLYLRSGAVLADALNNLGVTKELFSARLDQPEGAEEGPDTGADDHPPEPTKLRGRRPKNRADADPPPGDHAVQPVRDDAAGDG